MAAQRKITRKHTDPAEDAPLPVHSFHTLLADLATLTRNVVRLGGDRVTTLLATPTAGQRRALNLIGVSLAAQTDSHRPISTISMPCSQNLVKFGLRQRVLVSASSPRLTARKTASSNVLAL